jgi:Cdc6-like AAA superfamily ATPase
VNIEEYLKRRSEELVKSSLRIKDSSLFDLNFIPKRIYERKELKIIADRIAEYVVTGIPNNLIIYGPRGSGKTLSLLYFLEILKKYDVKTFYIKAREFPTSYHIYQKLSNVPVFGYHTDELRKRAINEISGKSIIVIDEADFLEDFEFLYFTTRNTRASLILSAQNIQLSKRIDDAIYSSLQPFKIYFNEYNADDLYQILKMRAEDGLYSWEDSALKLISALVAHEYRGDARIALRALFRTALKDKWSEDDVIESVKEASKEVEETSLRELKDRDIIALFILSKLKETSKAYVYFNKSLVKVEGRALSKTLFLRIINYLQNLGLLTQVRKRAGKYYTIEVDVLVDDEMIKEEVERRFKNLNFL